MSISFNGLASGLDTSSWITSLTALKQAKVTTLQQQREELVVSKNTLSSIRSFFTSFRSTLEKITDSRFNIVSMNLFAQNLATSANLSVLSATATSEAEEGKYEVKVDKIATNTQAVSKYKHTTTVEKTKLADRSSTLVSIGANVGSFTINLDGDIKTVNIASDTTIGSLISTLKGYGIDAEFNEKTGIFSADIDADDITENGTNIKNALHLVSENKGYFSTNLIYDKVDENSLLVANENTLIWDIQGMKPAAKEMVDDRDDNNDENNRTLTLTAGGESFYVYLDDDETIGSLVNDINNDAEMQAKGVVASFENGVFKLVNAVVSGVGQTGFDEAFGMGDNISTNIVQRSENLSYEAPVYIYKSASLDSKLVDLNTGIKLNDGDTVEVMNSNGISTTITMSEDMTIGDLFAEMEDAGLEITLNENGTVDLTSGVVTGGTYDVLKALGLRDGGVLREKTVQVVGSTINEDTTLGTMGVSGTLTIYNEDDSVHETITIDSDSEMTIGEFLAELESKGITSATLTDGVITLNSDENRYVAGDLATALGIDVIRTTNESSTLAVTYTQKLAATGEIKLVDVEALESIFNGNPATTAKIFVYDSNGTQVNTISVTGSESLENLVEKLNTAGFEAELESGRISLSSTNGNYLGGAVASALGLNAVRATVANSITSDTPVIYEKTYDVTYTIGISQTSTGQITQRTNTDSLTSLSAVSSSLMVTGNTFKISTTEDLQALAAIVNSGNKCAGATFVLANDIDLSSIDNWTAIGWTNVSTTCVFSGTFDGNGYEISGLSIDSHSYEQGLFGYTDGATIKNLGLTGVDVTSTGSAGDYVGALVGHAVYSTIQNVYTEGSVSGSGNVGGLVGYAKDSTLTSCQASGTVVGSSGTVGGLVGYIQKGTIISSSSSANVSGQYSVGGIAGEASSATLISVYSTGTLDDTDNTNVYKTGGLVGLSYGALTIRDSWTKASVDSGGGSVVGYVDFGTALISNTQALSDNYYASLDTVYVTATTSGCSASATFDDPFTIDTNVNNHIEVDSIGSIAELPSEGTYKISTTADLQALATLVNSGFSCFGLTFVLANDIDLSSIENWTAIGLENETTTCAFSGTFDGNGYEITGLSIDSSSHSQGLFGYTDGATIKNLGLTGVDIISTGSRVGALVGYAENSTIENVYTEGAVSGYSRVGGLVGNARSSTITSCQASGTVVGSNLNVGGLVGYMYSGTIISSSSSANVSGKDYVGGIAGEASSATLISVYSTGTLDDTDNKDVDCTGGLVGYSSYGLTIQDSWTKATVESGGGSVVGYVDGGGPALISNTQALSDNYYASIDSYATVTTSGCSASATFNDPFRIEPRKLVSVPDSYSNISLYQVGLNGTYSITVSNEGTLTTLTISSTDTFSSFEQQLESAGLSVEFSTLLDQAQVILNSVTISGNEGAYIVGDLDSRLEKAFNLEDKGTAMTTTKSSMTTINATLTEDTTFAELGFDNSGNKISYTLYSANGSEIGTYTHSSHLKVEEFLSVLNSNGFTAEIVDGRLSIESNGGNYIKSDSLDKFNITDPTYTVYSANAGYDYKTFGTTATSTVAIVASAMTTVGISQTSTRQITQHANTDSLTALSAVTASDMVSGSTFKISTTADLEKLATFVNGGTSCSGVTFVMSNDIDLSCIANWTAIGGVNGTTTCAFSGTFDGNGYEISGMTINPSSHYQGLFGYTDGATIRNLGLTEVDITSPCSYVGALVGRADNSTIENVYTAGTVSGSSYLGGLVGYIQNGTIISSSSSANVSGNGVIGGIAGNANSATLISVYSTGTLEDIIIYEHETGGLVGVSSGGLTIQDSWTKATVESGGGSVVGCVQPGTALISNTQALSDNYYASIHPAATGTTSGCSASSSFTNPFTVTTAAYATSATKMSEIGLTDTCYITVMRNGTESTITVSTTTTIDTLCSSLKSKGIYAKIENGYMTISGDGNSYIKGELDDRLDNILNLTDVARTYTVIPNNTTTKGITYTSGSKIGQYTEYTDTTNLTALSAVTASDMVSGRTYKISTTADLEALATIVNGGTNCSGVTFVMSNDIDLSSIANWTAIGDCFTEFSGTFDGNGYEISGLTIDATTDFQGLFGYTNRATIKNLGLTGVDVTSTGAHVGALVGEALNSTIQNVYTEGTVSGASSVGGLVGKASASTLTSCQISGTVVGSSSIVGGLVGFIYYGTITSSSSSANVSGTGNVGGIVGQASNGATLISVYSTGTLDDTDNLSVYSTGGLVGYSFNGLTIRDSWTKATVESGGGSVVGYVDYGTALISNTQALSDNYYASITVTATGTTSGCSASSSFTNPFTVTMTARVTSATKMSEIGLTDTRYITVMSNGTESTIMVNTTSSIDNLCVALNAKGFTASFTDGKITIAGAENVYIKGRLDDELRNVLNLNDPSSIYTYVQKTNTNQGVTFTSTAELEETASTYNLTALSAVTAGEVVSGKTFKISTTEDLEKLATFVNGGTSCAGVTFVMSNDIDLSSIANWTAIGNYSTRFSGTFDGNGYEISGLSIDASTASQGLFGYTDGATIRNLGLTEVDITSTNSSVGALVGRASNSTIQNVYTEGTVSGDSAVGGLLGYAGNSTLTSCQASGTVVGTAGVIGGLVGRVDFCTITSSSSSVNVSGTAAVGGIAGNAYSATLISVYSTGTIDDADNSSVYTIGGLVGYGESGLTIRDSWTKATVESGGGSVVGYVYNDAALISNTQTLSNNYYASIDSSATGTTSGCSASATFNDPFIFDIGVNKYATIHTSLGQLGLTSTRYVTINNNGTTYTCTATSDTTLGDFINDLKSKGLDVEYEDYKLTINQTDNAYIVGELDDELDDIFNFDNVYTSNAIENVTESDATLDEIIQAKYGLNWASWTGNSEIEIYNNGTTTTIDLSTINGSTTTGEFFDILESAGLTCSISNGIVSISGGEDVYISSDRDKKLADLFGFSGNYTSVQVTSLYLGDAYEANVVKTMTESTTLGELADRVITQNVAQEITNLSKDVSSLTALSAVTASDMVSGRTYKISTTADLEALATIVNGGTSCAGVTFVMSNDIDLSSIANWTAIGDSSYSFSGTFDGNGYEISGLSIDSSSDNQGLFGYTDGATIKNLGLTGVVVTSTARGVGALVGYAYNSTIQNVYTEGTVSGGSYVGGLVGSAYKSTLTSCQASGTVVGSLGYAGGLVGQIRGTIISSSSSANVSGQDSVGGIAGVAYSATLISVYSTGTLDDTDNTDVYKTGGLVGYSSGGLTIQDSWTKASVESGGGSVVGYVFADTALISNTQALSDNYYASITVTATGTTENCSTITAEETPFTVQAKKVFTPVDTFAEVGLTENVTLTVVQNGTETTITVTPTTSFETLMNRLENAGLSVGYNSIQGTDTAYVKGQVDPRLAEILGLEKQGVSTITAINPAGQTISATFTSEDTVGAISTWLRDNLGATVNIVDGKISISTAPNGPARIVNMSADLNELLKLDGDLQDVTNSENAVYHSGTTIMETLTISEDTYLSDLGVSEGEFYLYANGVKNVIQVTKDDTIGSLMQTLTSHGIDSEIVVSGENSYFKIFGDDDNYLEASTSPDNASNIMEILFPIKETEPSCYSNTLKVPETNASQEIATEDTLVSLFDKNGETSEGVLEFNYDGNDYQITIASDETFGTLIEKFEEVGISASIYNGQLVLNSTDKNLSIYSFSDSKLVTNLGLNYTTVLDNTTSSTYEISSKYNATVVIEGSAAQYADTDTKLSMLGISSGSLSIYRAGEKAQINVDADGTFATLQSSIKAAFTDVDLRFKDGYLEIYSTTSGVTIEVGATTDTSNIVAITGLSNKGELSAKSSRELYKVNGDSKLTEADIFKRGNVTEGTFIIGNAEFTIDDKTTLNNIIGQINSSAEANATAYWDAVDGKFVIKSRVSGATFVNIEAGTSNFTDILGFTITERDGDGNITSTKLNIDTQDVGGNAEFSINGTNYTSTSNIVGSDVTKIKGLTLDLKGTSNGETVTVTVEKDYNTAADAMQEVVDAYNALIENVDKEVAMDGQLNDESTLKLLRNQIRSLMMGSIGGSSPYRMLSSIGISTESASASNISTTTINKLEFNKDKFIEAFRADTKAVENLLVGNGTQQGILTKVENVVENAVKAVTGYFSSAENSYTQQINRLDTKIEKANAAVAAYKSRLEQKFQYMDMMIAKMQEQFSTFLGT